MSNEKTTSGGYGLFGVMFLLFLGLKLTDAIDWSWWWVTAPLWIPFAIVGCLLLIALIVAIIQKNI
jgi:hypothetical protein